MSTTLFARSVTTSPSFNCVQVQTTSSAETGPGTFAADEPGVSQVRTERMRHFAPPKQPMPDGNPRSPYGAAGERVQPGAIVRIIRILDWLTHDLPDDDVAALRAAAGTTRRILDIDAYGMVWFGDGAPWFCVEPTDVECLRDE